MTPRPVDIPMARAQAHLAQARYLQAIGAFRAALSVDPTLPAAQLGLAQALAAEGRHDEALAGLLAAAEHHASAGRTEAAAQLRRVAATWEAAWRPQPEEPVATVVPLHTALITGQTVIARNPLLAPEHGHAVVERLRARAGLRRAAGSPHHVPLRATEPIAIRQRIRAPTESDDDVTVRVRRPRPLDAAS